MMYSDLILIDTSAWVLYFRPPGNEKLITRIKNILSEGIGATSGIIMAELLLGTKTEREYARLSEVLEALNYLEPTEAIWYRVSKLGFILRRKGISIPCTDLVIAQIALDNNCRILHADTHFNLIASHTNLKVESE